MDSIPFAGDEHFFADLPDMVDDDLVSAARACLAAQREAADRKSFRPTDRAAELVSEEALAKVLGAGRTIHGLLRQREISNVISFNLRHIDDSITSERVRSRRRRVDELMKHRLHRAFESRRPLDVTLDGHFWCPPGGYTGWHENRGAPGWRFFLTHAEEPRKSFLRYREPRTGEIVTSWDSEWDLRALRIDPRRPLWHAVHSETNRFSFGYVVCEPQPFGELRRKVRGLLSTTR